MRIKLESPEGGEVELNNVINVETKSNGRIAVQYDDSNKETFGWDWRIIECIEKNNSEISDKMSPMAEIIKIKKFDGKIIGYYRDGNNIYKATYEIKNIDEVNKLPL